MALLLLPLLAPAQMQMPSKGLSISTKMFGDIKAFSAQSESLVKTKTETMVIPMAFALLDGKIRLDLDLGQMKTRQFSPDQTAAMKQMGMDKLINIVLPENKIIWLIFPALKAYAEMPMPDEVADMNDKDVKVEETALNKETVDGHPCVKHKVVVTDKKGKKQEGFAWRAADLKNFPVKMEFTDPEATVTMNFKNVKLTAPDGKQYEPPAGFTKYSDLQQMMQATMLKALSGN